MDKRECWEFEEQIAGYKNICIAPTELTDRIGSDQIENLLLLLNDSEFRSIRSKLGPLTSLATMVGKWVAREVATIKDIGVAATTGLDEVRKKYFYFVAFLFSIL